MAASLLAQEASKVGTEPTVAWPHRQKRGLGLSTNQVLQKTIDEIESIMKLLESATELELPLEAADGCAEGSTWGGDESVYTEDDITTLGPESIDEPFTGRPLPTIPPFNATPKESVAQRYARSRSRASRDSSVASADAAFEILDKENKGFLRQEDLAMLLNGGSGDDGRGVVVDTVETRSPTKSIRKDAEMEQCISEQNDLIKMLQITINNQKEVIRSSNQAGNSTNN